YQRIIYFETGLMISAINYDRTYSRIPVSLNQNTYLSSSVSILGIVLGCGLIVPKKTGIVKFRAGAELRITNQFYAPEVLMPAEMVYEPYSSDTINLPQVYIPSKFPDLSPALSVQFGVVVYPFRQKN
ncbi:MAG TPA: hypothetical protein VE978_03210, partial [Chitinophagales bacterium]|nr:hypothetical protein [Chitinophagales bacterium]